MQSSCATSSSLFLVARLLRLLLLWNGLKVLFDNVACTSDDNECSGSDLQQYRYLLAQKGICKDNKLYQTPELNETLFCGLQGFQSIANLERYTELKALFLDGNALKHIQGIPNLLNLGCLYLQQNVLSDLSGLERLPKLEALNVSSNLLEDLRALEKCETLQTLLCSNNNLASYESIAYLQTCPALATVDLQDNELDDVKVVEIFARMPKLRCLYLKGNPVVENIMNYRKTLISRIPGLTYLDDRPVFDVERRCAEAWARGGLEAERHERLQVQAEEADRHKQDFERLQRVRSQGFRKRRESLGMPEGDTDPFIDALSETEIQVEELPPELIAAEARLSQLQASKPSGAPEPEEDWNPIRMGSDDDGIQPLRPRPAVHDNAMPPIRSTPAKQIQPSVQWKQSCPDVAGKEGIDISTQSQAFLQELNACMENMTA